MKKITLQIFVFIFLISSITYGQNYSSGLFSVNGVVDGQIDINGSTNIVTLTLIGPSAGWIAMGFDTNSHSTDKDVVLFDGTNLSDRRFPSNSHSTPSLDGQQDWTVTSNTVSGGERTVVATRARDTGDSNDYIFPLSPTTLDVVGAYRNNFTISEHADFADTTINLVLGLEDFNKIQFSMSPNPATSDLKIALPSHLTKASIEIYDVLGRQIFNKNFNSTHVSIIDVSAWNSGVYLVKVLNDNSSQTKRFVKQ